MLFIQQKMKINCKTIRISDKNKTPFFSYTNETITFDKDAIIIKVFAFSIDPIMSVWLSGAKTNFKTIHNGDIFNCFGVGQIIQSNDDQNYPIGEYVWGNTGTVSYFKLTQDKNKQCFVIDKSLVEMYGAYKFCYLINNGLAAFNGFDILNVKQGQNVVVSTAAGATGLLLCHLLKKRNASIIALSSPAKHKYLTQYTSKIFDYRDKQILTNQLKKISFSKYFDNVGENQLDIILQLITQGGIIAMCGVLQRYYSSKEDGIKNYFQIITKRLRLEGINFSSFFPQAHQIFQQFKEAKLIMKIINMDEFIPCFLQLFKSGGSIVGKLIVDPHLQS